MVNRKLGILFLVSVILAFLAGYYISNVVEDPQPNTENDTIDFITSYFDAYYYYELDSFEKQNAEIAALEAAIRSYAQANNDPYTRLIPTPANVTPRSDERFVGIGIDVATEDHDFRVLYVYPDSAAENNLYPNDLIIGVVEEEPIYFEDLENELEASSYLVGDVDDEKELIVENPDGEINHVTITYKEIATPTAYTKDLVEEDIAYLRITQFSGYQQGVTEGTAQVFADRLREIELSILNENPENKTLILDLRDNPGGALTALHNQGETNVFPGVTQQLLRRDIENTLFTMIPRSGTTQLFYGELNQAKPYQIKVLVNENSASAAEVLAAALKTNGGYDLYGAPTYGKGVYQNYIGLEGILGIPYALAYTEGEWFYDDGKNVSTNPLDVQLIEQEGIKALDMPVYDGELSYDELSPSLVNYQHFLNYFFEFTGEDVLRTDGYFDLATEQAIITFNQLNAIDNEDILSRETAIKIHQIYMSDLMDLQKDVQLQNLIEIIKTP